jgi:Putative peptidase (DUF1758).
LNKCLLPTARVKLSGNNRYLHNTVLLDSGSNCNLITKELARRLNLKGFSCKINVQGVSGRSQSTIQCLVVDSITSPLPAFDIDVFDWNIPKHLKLADPEFNISKEIGILLSSDIVFNVLCSGKIPQRHRKLPFLLNSKLGWLFAGACESMSQPNSANSLFTVHVANQLGEQEQINNSWYNLEVPDVVQSVDEVCEASGSETVISNDEDWYVESLPMKVSPSKVCDSIPHEVKEHFIEKGFDSSPDLRETHCEVKDVSDMCQNEVLHNTEFKSIGT